MTALAERFPDARHTIIDGAGLGEDIRLCSGRSMCCVRERSCGAENGSSAGGKAEFEGNGLTATNMISRIGARWTSIQLLPWISLADHTSGPCRSIRVARVHEWGLTGASTPTTISISLACLPCGAAAPGKMPLWTRIGSAGGQERLRRAGKIIGGHVSVPILPVGSGRTWRKLKKHTG